MVPPGCNFDTDSLCATDDDVGELLSVEVADVVGVHVSEGKELGGE